MKYFSEITDFYKQNKPSELLEQFGSPLYVYNEDILRQRARQIKSLVDMPNFEVSYSIKANSNLHILKILKEEGLYADAMSDGEIFILEKAGYEKDDIFFVCNNVSAEEMRYAVDRGIMVSVDSLSQLDLYGRNFPKSKVSVRLNPGIGAGHHQKVVTGGKTTKFGINLEKIEDIFDISRKYNLKITGINQHIGSLFMSSTEYLRGVNELLQTALFFKDLEFIDFGGGFGIPYKKQEGQQPLELVQFGQDLKYILSQWQSENKRDIIFRCEPGRFVVAESSILLGKVYAKKNNYNKIFIGTDLGFSVLIRPAMYGSHHDIEVYRKNKLVKNKPFESVNITGNICESGDILVEERELPVINEEDIIGVMDAGAYGYSMSSNYNNRMRPAEVLIKSNGSVQLIRKRDTFEDLIKGF
ncbi:MAG: Diaminopimelate decarboxylase [Firmicutes bacterium ADurb.Bin146]|nr:MAG: Diaminopimelate decarboxylase [Firmicutes bacterium ADurb.Bin146]